MGEINQVTVNGSAVELFVDLKEFWIFRNSMNMHPYLFSNEKSHVAN